MLDWLDWSSGWERLIIAGVLAVLAAVIWAFLRLRRGVDTARHQTDDVPPTQASRPRTPPPQPPTPSIRPPGSGTSPNAPANPVQPAPHSHPYEARKIARAPQRDGADVAAERPAPPAPAPVPSAGAPTAGASVGEDLGAYVAVTVHYGTDRRDTGVASDQASRYTYERAVIDGGRAPMSYGSCQVSIPKSHTVGGLEDRSWWQWATMQGRTPDKFVMVTSVTPAAAADFFQTLRAAVARSGKKDAFVFVHGFSVSFADAARRTAQMAFDMKFQGAPVMFSWPTPDLSISLFTSYTTSESNAILSTDRFRQFLKDVIERTGAGTVHLIAHSMGNRLVTDALNMLDAVDNANLKARIGEVILTAPDIDATVFTSVIAPRITKFSPRVTLYASSKDKALQASQSVHSFPRIGEFQSLMQVPLGVDVIDASAVYDGSDGLNHSYYGDSEPVIGDICYLLSLGGRAAERKLTLTGAKTPGGDACWSIVQRPLADIYAAIAAGRV